jgi:hypothetical protein
VSATDEPISFEQHIKPLFRERDRQSMKWALDLWSRDDLVGNAEAILRAFATGRCPATAPGQTTESPSSKTGSKREGLPRARSNAARANGET